MSWLFSQVLVEEYLGGNFSDGEQSAPLNGNPIQQAYCAPDKMTAFSRLSRFGMTYKPLTENRGQELLTLYLADFHAKTSQPQEKAQELMESVQECGEKWRASFTKYDHDSSLWRTHQCSLLGDLEPFSETWPQWGLMRDGECWEQLTLERHIRGTESGLSEKIPTPNAKEPGEKIETWKKRADKKKKEGINLHLKLSVWVQMNPVSQTQEKWPTPRSCSAMAATLTDKGDRFPNLETVLARTDKTTIGGKLNPTWVEWLMGWPLGWTDLKPLETDRFHYALPQLSKSSTILSEP
jgi:hypothetical protein